MSGQSRTLAGILALVVAVLTAETGCHGTSRRTIGGSTATSSGEPAFSSNVVGSSPGVTIVEPGAPVEPALVTPSSTVGWVDRHPLLRKPQQYFDNTNSNKLVKTAAATFVGVPAGFIGEIKQIVVGKPTAVAY